jgi:recombination protein RecT
MNTENTQVQKQPLTQKSLFARPDVTQKFTEMLGKRSTSFITSVLQITASNDMLKNAEPTSVYQAACIAATLDLPLNNNLGFAYIVPFNNRKKGIVEAQFQLGYKGFIQLAQRSGQVKTIGANAIYEGQIVSSNPLSGYVFDFETLKSDKIIGYASQFTLLNGFESTKYMSIEEIEKHAKRFSQTYKSGYGIWKDDFESMAMKTVLKLNLSKYAPLSVEMQTALITDQSVIKNSDTLDVSYTDNSDLIVQLPVLELGSKNFEGCKNALRTGDATIEEIEMQYELSEEIKTELLK